LKKFQPPPKEGEGSARPNVVKSKGERGFLESTGKKFPCDVKKNIGVEILSLSSKSSRKKKGGAPPNYRGGAFPEA